ncbi:MAG: hypothetical protein ACR2QK_22110, partial [Acidimicrobiales bacterium]
MDHRAPESGRSTSLLIGPIATALAAMAVLASCSFSEPAVEGPSSTDTAAAPTAVDGGELAASDRPEIEAPRSIWTRAEDQALRPDQASTVFGGAIGPSHGLPWTIVGSVFDFETNRSVPTLWEADAPERSNPWERSAVEDEPDVDAEIAAVARSTELDVAVGSRGRGEARRPAAWVRRAGGDWQTVALGQFLESGEGWLVDIDIGPDGGSMLAMGRTVDDTGLRPPTVWSSDDGLTWSPVEGVPIEADGSEDVHGVSIGPSRSVLTGSTDLRSEESAAAWWSEDGLAWNEAMIDIPADATESFLREVVWFQDRFVAVGGVGLGGEFRPAAWSSADGVEWQLETRSFEMLD